MSGTMMLLPAKAGTCAVCATDHEPHLAHNCASLFYGMRFKMTHGRDPTWADAVAHLTPEQAKEWKRAMKAAKVKWTDTPTPISEPYEVSKGFMQPTQEQGHDEDDD